MTITIGTPVRVLKAGPIELHERDLIVVGVWHHNRWLRSCAHVERLAELTSDTWLQVRVEGDNEKHIAPWLVKMCELEVSPDV